MPYFDWLPALGGGDDDQDQGPTLQQLGADPNSPAVKGTASQQDKRRKLVQDEDATVQLEQGGIRKIHNALKSATIGATDFENYADTGDPEIHQVKDALDKGMLKPHQVMSDVEQLLKKKRDFPGLAEQLADGLNDLKASQQQRQAQAEAGKALPVPQVDPSVYAGHSDEAFGEAKKLREEASNMGVLGSQEKIRSAKNYEAQGESLNRLAQEAAPPKIENDQIGPQKPPDLESVIKSQGMSKEQFLAKAAALANAVGWTQNTTLAPGAFGYALTAVLSGMGDGGTALMDGFNRTANPAPNNSIATAGKGQQQNPAEVDPYQQRIMAKQDELADAVRDVKNLKTFDSVWSVIFFALFSAILGPGPAALLFTNKAKRGELREEVKFLDNELERMIQTQGSNLRMKEQARHNAAMETLQKDKFEHDVYKDEEYLKLRRMSPSGKDPDYEDALHGYRMQKDALNEVEATLNNQFNYTPDQIKLAQQNLPKAKARVDAARNNVLKILNLKAENRQANAVKP